MNRYCAVILIALTLLAAGCSSEKSVAPSSEAALDYNVIGNDTPQDMETAMRELRELSISVPDPVRAGDPVLTEEIDTDAALAIVNSAALDDSARVNFRRIVAHLHDQQRALRRCMASNDDPQLRRLAHGSAQAIHRGMRALRNDEPRMALRSFRAANRLLNLAREICQGGN